jgi:aminoglycoside phosphotransferase (APT) family kinase protein
VGLTATDALDALLPVLAEALGVGRVELVAAHPLSAGASRLTSTLDIQADGVAHRLVLQRSRVADSLRDMAAEAKLLRAASQAGVPVPTVIAAGPGLADLPGAYLVTSYVDGETIPRRIQRDPALGAARERFAADCGRILAAIHAIAVDAVGPLAAPDPLDVIGQMLDRVGARRPAFELGLRWLRANRPAGLATTVLHGDFRNGNLIVGPDGVRAVLDWELAHGGDPREDLGWLCARVWRFGGPLPVGGLGTLPELLDSYAGSGGARVREAELLWWQVLAALRWGAICLEQARVHLSGEFRSVELATIGRRAAEMEYEVLRMLP